MKDNENALSWHILIIDDDAHLSQSLSFLFQQYGYTAEAATDCRTALAALQEKPADLVFLDLRLPKCNGLELLPEIHKLLPRTPVVILTAYADIESALKALRLGARDYILKPAEPEQIIRRIEEIQAECMLTRRREALIRRAEQLWVDVMENELAQTRQPEGLQTPGLEMGDISQERHLKYGSISLDLRNRQVTVKDRPVKLTNTGFAYLVCLVRHAPEMASNKTLVCEAQGYEVLTVEARELARSRIHEIRKALRAAGDETEYIQTVRGSGYKLSGL